MELALLVWFASIVGNISFVLGWVVLALLGIVISDIIVTGSHNSVYDNKKKYPFQKTWGKWCTTVALVLAVVVGMIPTEKTVYFMAAGYAGQKVVQSEAADKVVKIINGKLDEYLKEAEEKLSSKEKK